MSTRKEYYEDGDIPWINSGEVNQPRVKKAEKFITKLGVENSSAKIFPSQTVLVAMYGATAGKTSILDIEATTNQAICGIFPSKKYNSEFLKYSLDFLYNYLVGVSSGSARDNLSQTGIQELKVAMPDLSKQQKIAKVLSALDEKLDLNSRINAELEKIAETLYGYWFVQFDFPNEEGNPYRASGGKMVWNEELKREIPLGWQRGVLSDIGTIAGGSTPSKEVDEFYSQKGIAWITPKDLSLNSGNKFITKGEIGLSEKGIKAVSLDILPKGTILLSSRAPIGYMAIARQELTTNQGFKSFVPNKGYSTAYIYYTIKSLIPTIINHSSKSTFKEASATVLKGIPLCLPQTSLTQKFHDAVYYILEKQDNLELESQKLAELRDWLLPMLMNGQIAVA